MEELEKMKELVEQFYKDFQEFKKKIADKKEEI